MLYSQWISELRAQTGDTLKYEHIDFTADGSSNVLVLPSDTFPIYDDATTYSVKVATVLKTENVDYTLDKAGGTIKLVSTPTVGTAVTIDHKKCKLQDADYLKIINDTIRSLGDDFWKEFTVDSTFTTTAGMTSLSLVALKPKCIAVYEFQYRENSSSNWEPVAQIVNWRYDRDNNVIYLGRNDAFTASGQGLRVRGLDTYTLGTTVADTIDLQDKFFTILESGCLARFYRWRYKEVIELVSKMVTETTRTPLQELIMLVDRYERNYETEKMKLKPQKPSRIVPKFLQEGGRP